MKLFRLKYRHFTISKTNLSPQLKYPKRQSFSPPLNSTQLFTYGSFPKWPSNDSAAINCLMWQTMISAWEPDRDTQVRRHSGPLGQLSGHIRYFKHWQREVLEWLHPASSSSFFSETYFRCVRTAGSISASSSIVGYWYLKTKRGWNQSTFKYSSSEVTSQFYPT